MAETVCVSISGNLSSCVSTVRKEVPSQVEDGAESLLFQRDASTRYTGHFTQTVMVHPIDTGMMIKSVGALLVIGKCR